MCPISPIKCCPISHCAKYGPSKYLHRASVQPNLSLQIGPQKHNAWKAENTVRALRNKEMRGMRKAELCEAPKSTLKVNNKEKNIKKLYNIRSCRKPVLSEAGFRCFFFLHEAVWAELEARCSQFRTPCVFTYSFKRVKNGKGFNITIMKTKVLPPPQERVRTVTFRFHDTAPLEFDLNQNGCEMMHTCYLHFGCE
jgi:hypothetical protein